MGRWIWLSSERWWHPGIAGRARILIIALIQSDSKQRYEISGDRVRARYGHSVDVDLDHPENKSPLSLLWCQRGGGRQDTGDRHKAGIVEICSPIRNGGEGLACGHISHRQSQGDPGGCSSRPERRGEDDAGER